MLPAPSFFQAAGGNGESQEALREHLLADLSKSASLEDVISSRRSALEYIDKSISLGQFLHIHPIAVEYVPLLLIANFSSP